MKNPSSLVSISNTYLNLYYNIIIGYTILLLFLMVHFNYIPKTASQYNKWNTMTALTVVIHNQRWRRAKIYVHKQLHHIRRQEGEGTQEIGWQCHKQRQENRNAKTEDTLKKGAPSGLTTWLGAAAALSRSFQSGGWNMAAAGHGSPAHRHCLCCG